MLHFLSRGCWTDVVGRKTSLWVQQLVTEHQQNILHLLPLKLSCRLVFCSLIDFGPALSWTLQCNSLSIQWTAAVPSPVRFDPQPGRGDLFSKFPVLGYSQQCSAVQHSPSILELLYNHGLIICCVKLILFKSLSGFCPLV